MAAEPTSLTVHRDIRFRETRERALLLDVYEPVETGPRPAVLFVHGGGFTAGDKGQFARHALDLADRGYVAVASQYRLASEAPFPAALVDVKAAIAWLRTEGEAYGVDTDRIAVVGYSAGGNLATLAALTPEDAGYRPDGYPGVSLGVDAAVGYAGVYDVAAWDDPEANRRYLERAAGSASGGTSGNGGAGPDVADLTSPLGQADVGAPPTLLLHGRDDESVDPAQSERFHEELSAVTTATLELLAGDGADHGFPHSSHTYDETIDLTVTFLERHLGP